MRFVCDSTVGRLARLLRMAGFDTAYVKEDSLARVLALSKEERRVIVTRNSKLLSLQMASDLYWLQQDEPMEQFRRMALDLKVQIDSKLLLTRCVECNSPLETVDKEVIRARLYDYVARTQDHILVCRHCDKLYWHATHAQAMIKRLLEIKSELDQMSDETQSNDSE
jgi:uncharacterized protein